MSAPQISIQIEEAIDGAIMVVPRANEVIGPKMFSFKDITDRNAALERARVHAKGMKDGIEMLAGVQDAAWANVEIVEDTFDL